MRYLLALILCGMFGSSHAQIDITTDLIAYYPFNGNANDESGNDNHGIVEGAVLTTDALGQENSAYEFNGINTYISVPGSDSLKSPVTELTMVALVNPYSLSKVGSAFGPILMKSSSSGNAFQYRLGIGNGSIFGGINNWNNGASAGVTYSFNRWYAVAMTLKGDSAKLFFNGRLIAEGTIVGPITPDDFVLEIGRDVPGALEVFNGKIDEIRIYNRELTERETQFASGVLFTDSYESME